MKLEHEAYVRVAEAAYFLSAQAAYVGSVDGDGAAVGLVECSHYLQECCLSGSAGSHDAHHFALVYVQVDALEHLQ